MNEKIQKILNYCNTNPKTKGIIVDLKTVIDEIQYSFTNLKDIINELARRLDEDNICKTDKISQVIKQFLIDKIKEDKISAKWIEECLPREYKRNYTIKNEVSSLASKIPKTTTITNNSFEVLDNNISSTFQSVKDYSSKNENELLHYFDKKDENDNEIKRLREIVNNYEKFIIADQIFSENTVFVIPKEKF